MHHIIFSYFVAIFFNIVLVKSTKENLLRNTKVVENEEQFEFDQLKPAPNYGKNLIQYPNDDDPPGEHGVKVVIKNPTPEQQILIARGYERNSFNEFVSDLISIHRNLPDVRNDWCKKPGLYLNEDQLLPTSIIMCFYNEAWSVLLRSIHSILNRTPTHLLTEVI